MADCVMFHSECTGGEQRAKPPHVHKRQHMNTVGHKPQLLCIFTTRFNVFIENNSEDKLKYIKTANIAIHNVFLYNNTQSNSRFSFPY